MCHRATAFAFAKACCASRNKWTLTIWSGKQHNRGCKSKGSQDWKICVKPEAASVDRRCYREAPRSVRVHEGGYSGIWSQWTGWEGSLGSFHIVPWPLCKDGKNRTERKQIWLWWGFMWEPNLCKTSCENVCLLQLIWHRHTHITVGEKSSFLANFLKSTFVLKRNLGMIA